MKGHDMKQARMLKTLFAYHERDFPCAVQRWLGGEDREIRHVANNSEKVQDKTLFFAIRGTRHEGHDYINQAVKRGAVAICCEHIPCETHSGVSYIQVESTAQTWAWLAERWHQYPSRKLSLVGVTGTNGKTTTVHLLYQLFLKLGYSVGMMSTVAYEIKGCTFGPATHTTPDAWDISKMLHRMREENCAYGFMEVSSHALAQHRVVALSFAAAVYTNLTQDHLDYHGSFAQYVEVKKKLFDQLPESAYAVVNADDSKHGYVVQNTRAKVLRYSLKNPSEYKVKVVENTAQGLLLKKDQRQISLLLRGEFNAYNATAAVVTACRVLGRDEEKVWRSISKLSGPTGRLELVSGPHPFSVFVDFAHTPDALEQVLKTLRQCLTLAGQKIIVVIGCGGDRDQTKRAEMGKVACRLAHRAIFTSDNPRFEKPTAIIQDMLQRLDKVAQKEVVQEAKREQAIAYALQWAKPQDLVLIAGKGHERYQEIRGKRYPFSDQKVVKQYLEGKELKAR